MQDMLENMMRFTHLLTRLFQEPLTETRSVPEDIWASYRFTVYVWGFVFTDEKNHQSDLITQYFSDSGCSAHIPSCS